jgi:hypothetical protein
MPHEPHADLNAIFQGLAVDDVEALGTELRQPLGQGLDPVEVEGFADGDGPAAAEVAKELFTLGLGFALLHVLVLLLTCKGD